MRHGTRIACATALLLTLPAAPAATAADAGPTHVDGQLPSGATYMMDVPTNWNGTVLLFSHGYNAGPANPAQDAPDAATKPFSSSRVTPSSAPRTRPPAGRSPTRSPTRWPP